jgi:hypothetical protein
MNSVLRLERREASTARVPAPRPGQAITFTRYEKEQAVVLNPQDFHRLAALDAALEQRDRTVPSDLALRAHAKEDRPFGAAVEDPVQIKTILGL